jgi:hypothetical protein
MQPLSPTKLMTPIKRVLVVFSLHRTEWPPQWQKHLPILLTNELPCVAQNDIEELVLLFSSCIQKHNSYYKNSA